MPSIVPIVAKTLMERDSGYGVPIGVLVLFFILLKTLRSNQTENTYSSNAEWERRLADQQRRDTEQFNEMVKQQAREFQKKYLPGGPK